MTSFLRHRHGEDRRTPPERFAALAPEHAFVGVACWACAKTFVAGDVVTLFAVGPTDPAEAIRADQGRWYTALAVPMHQRCAWGENWENDPKAQIAWGLDWVARKDGVAL